MKVLVLGAAGLQAEVAVHDLLQSPDVTEVIAADTDQAGLARLQARYGNRLLPVALDASEPAAIAGLMKDDVAVALCLLPSRLAVAAAEAAVVAGCNLVNTNYGSALPDGIGARAAAAGVTLMPESGLDPGIDLVLCGYGASQLDEVHELHSWCGGIPEPAAADNPLRYKVSWSWEGVLKSYCRPGRMMRDGQLVRIAAGDQHNPDWVQEVDFPGIGPLELIPNGDAILFAEHLGLADQIRDTTRCTFRWPGHSALWRSLTELGFLEESPLAELGGVSPREFMIRHLEPRLAYGSTERDMVVMRVIVGGVRDGQPVRLVYDLVDRRDLETGFMAMTRTVGFTASIVTQMVGTGEIAGRGLLTAVRDIPQQALLDRLAERGITIHQPR